MEKKLRLGSLCVQAGYKAKNGEPIELPIIQSTTFKYDDSDEMAQLFDLKKEGYFYTRLQNPTNDAVAAKIAALEGGVGAVLTSSGQAANFYALFNICEAGDHFVTSNEIYGGTFNLFGVTLKKLGIECTFVSPEASDEEIQAAFRPNTKAMFGETITNPGCAVLDIERFARIAHQNGVPLIIDNTFATPINCRPFEWGADIVTHSTTKYMDGFATQVGGAVVDSGNFDWMKYAEKFPGLCTPDESYHGLTYVKAFGKMGYTTKLVAQLMRDLGSIPAPQNSFLLNIGLLAVISEIPYDRAVKGEWLTWQWQNVCFTFLLSWLMLMALHNDWSKMYEKFGLEVKGIIKVSAKLTGLGITALLFILAAKINVDYIYYGTALVLLFDFARNRRFRKLWEFIAIVAFIGSAGSGLTSCYLTCFFSLALIWWAEWDAKRPQKKNEKVSKVLLSKPSKMICRYFYPAHLIVLMVIALVMNGVMK